jgi:hypothetical protein
MSGFHAPAEIPMTTLPLAYSGLYDQTQKPRRRPARAPGRDRLSQDPHAIDSARTPTRISTQRRPRTLEALP